MVSLLLGTLIARPQAVTPIPDALIVGGKTTTIAERMRLHSVPGCAVVVIRDFRVASARYYGRTTAGGSHAVTRSTLFSAGQMSEPVAHILALRMVDAGRLTLDQPIRPQLKRYHLPTSTTELTLRHLIEGRGGYDMPKYMGYELGAQIPTLIDELNETRQVSDPGATWRRSPVNVSVMETLMEDVSGRSMNALLATLFPNGRTRYLSFPPKGNDRGFAQGHEESGTPCENGGRVYPELAATGLWTTGEEFGRFLAQLMANTQGRSHFPLGPQTVGIVLSPISTQDPAGSQIEAESAVFGADTFPDLAGHPKRAFYRGGATKGYYCQFWLVPEKGNAILVLTNRQLAYKFCNEIRDAILPGLL